DTAITVYATCSDISEIKYRGAQAPNGRAFCKHVGKAWIAIIRCLTQMGGKQRFVVATQATDANTTVVQESTAAAAGRKQFIARRIVYDRLRDLAFLHQCDGNRVQGQTMDEIRRAVDWIDHPLKFWLFDFTAVRTSLAAGFFAQKR